MPAAGREGPWAWGSSSGQAGQLGVGHGCPAAGLQSGPSLPFHRWWLAGGSRNVRTRAVGSRCCASSNTGHCRGEREADWGGAGERWRVEVGVELRTRHSLVATAHLPLGFVQGRGCSYLNSWESNSPPSVLPSGDGGPEDNDAVAWPGAGSRESSCLQGAEEIPRPMGPLPCSSVEPAQEEATAPRTWGAACLVVDLPSAFS